MKIAITGASGFDGAQLVKHLAAKGADLLLVGRNPDQLSSRIPGFRCCGYDDLAEQASGFDLIVQCAVANTGSSVPEAEIFKANVGLVEQVADAAATLSPYTVEQKRAKGLILDTIGETKQMFSSGRPVNSPVCKKAMDYLRDFVVTGSALKIGRT